jgi:hypothetical protein
MSPTSYDGKVNHEHDEEKDWDAPKVSRVKSKAEGYKEHQRQACHCCVPPANDIEVRFDHFVEVVNQRVYPRQV